MGVAIGSCVLDVTWLAENSNLLAGCEGVSAVTTGAARGAGSGDEDANDVVTCFSEGSLKPFMALGQTAWRSVRARLQRLLAHQSAGLGPSPLRDDDAYVARRSEYLHPLEPTVVSMRLPCDVGDYTDFYSSREHAYNVGCMFRGPENALQENWSTLPVGYHGRASSIVVSGTPVRRPCGQRQRKKKKQEENNDNHSGIAATAATAATAVKGCGIGATGDDVVIKGETSSSAAAGGPTVFGPCEVLDFELEVGVFVGGPENDLGTTTNVNDAASRVFGFVLLNDWSARDLQKWEYVPLGPFTAKSFATSISPWVVTPDALASVRCDPPPQTLGPVQPYLREVDRHCFDVPLTVGVVPRECYDTPSGGNYDGARTTGRNEKKEAVIVRSNLKHLYWTPQQMIAHHTVTGCNLRPGDLLGTVRRFCCHHPP